MLQCQLLTDYAKAQVETLKMQHKVTYNSLKTNKLKHCKIYNTNSCGNGK